MIEKLPAVAADMISAYQNLKIGEQNVCTPYFINTGQVKDLRVMVGKGTPEEIEIETKIWAQLKGMDLNKMTPAQIRQFMRTRKIGIDCSGFVYHVFDSWVRQTANRRLSQLIVLPNASLLKKFKIWLRPAENLGAEILTNEHNTQKIDLKEIRPGDLIRSRSAQHESMHLLLIIEVERQDGKVTRFDYAHSTWSFGENNGVRIGRVIVTNQNAELKDQQWTEVDENGVSLTLQGIIRDYADNGLRRPIYAKYLK